MADERLTRMEPVDADSEHPRPLPGVALLPSAATLGNLICGFLAIICCVLEIRATYFDVDRRLHHAWLVEFFPTWIAVGVYLIVVAMICDAMDGRLARIARRTSEFGAQLDSISDIVSFGVAPAMLFLTLLLRLAVPPEGDPFVSRMQWRLGLWGVLVYLSCAAIRLARFNAENTRDESTQKRFSGLPSPGAAAALIALLAFHEDLVFLKSSLLGVDWANVTRWTIAVMAFVLGGLMVSRLDYVHVFNVYFRREHPPTHLVWLLVLMGVAWFWWQLALVVLAYAYVVSGVVLNLLRMRGPRPLVPLRPSAN